MTADAAKPWVKWPEWEALLRDCTICEEAAKAVEAIKLRRLRRSL